jgi:threonine synthase
VNLRIGDHVRRVVCSRTKRVLFEREELVRPLGLCTCCPAPGSPLVVEYHASARALGFENTRGIWRYQTFLPVAGLPESYAADVGRTPLVRHGALSEELGVEVLLKLEGGNPSGSFKDRGLAVGVALGKALGARRVCLPTQGNAGVAAAMFAARLGMQSIVYMPTRHEGSVYHRAAAHFGATIHFFGPNIAAAGAEMRRVLTAELAAGEILDVSTFFEPGRLDGKKTMGFEIVEDLGDRSEALPDWIVYPTGGGTGLVGIWKAFRELDIPLEKRPRMCAVQSSKCPPVVRSFERGLDHVEKVTSEGTIADGLDVPGAIMGHGILEVLRESNGTAIAVDDETIVATFRRLARAGLSASYEAAATVTALEALVKAGTVAKGSRALLLFTAGYAVTLG